MDWRSRTLKKKRCSPKGNAFLILVRREKEGVWGIKIKKCKLNGGEDSGGRPLHFSRVQVWHSVPDILFVIAYLPVYNYFPILTSMVHFPFPHRPDPTPTPRPSRPPSPPFHRTGMNYNSHANNIHTMHANTPSTCCDFCGTTEGCTFWTFVDEKCYLKNATIGTL